MLNFSRKVADEDLEDLLHVLTKMSTRLRGAFVIVLLMELFLHISVPSNAVTNFHYLTLA